MRGTLIFIARKHIKNNYIHASAEVDTGRGLVGQLAGVAAANEGVLGVLHLHFVAEHDRVVEVGHHSLGLVPVRILNHSCAGLVHQELDLYFRRGKNQQDKSDCEREKEKKGKLKGKNTASKDKKAEN